MAAEAQQAVQVYRIGRLSGASPTSVGHLHAAAIHVLRENVAIDDPGGWGDRVSTAPRWLFIVRRDQSRLFAHLREAFAGVDSVEVILDRRAADDSSARRGAWQRSERRASLTKEEQQLWEVAGFRLVYRDQDFTILRTDADRA